MKHLLILFVILLMTGCNRKNDIRESIGNGDMNSTTGIAKDSMLGKLQIRTFEGTLSTGSNLKAHYRLTVSNYEYSGDGTFILTVTDHNASNRKDGRSVYKGKRYTQRGTPHDNDTTVWQLIANNGKDIFNFLVKDEKTITLLDNHFESYGTKEDQNLNLIE